jgi:5,10-methylenetetrahydrofolate reductase
MIVAERKPMNEILEMLAPYRKVLVLGCGGCVTVCLTGGEQQADLLAGQLRLAAEHAGRQLTADVDCITRQCEREFFDNLQENPDDYEAVLSLACGAGVGYMSELYPDVPVLPAMNTTFLGSNVAQGVWTEYCRGCGDCALAWTGGICPIAKCSKSLINGTCGGTNDGKCEVDPDMDCGWLLIYKRLEALGRLEEYRKLRPVPDHRRDRGGGVRRLVLQEMTETEEEPAMAEPVSKLQAALQAADFVYTGEIGPPKGTNIAPVIHEAVEHLKDTVTAVNVTDIQTAVMRAGSLAGAKLLLDAGIEPVFQMVCRDRNRLALQSDLLNASIFGVRNVLALTGDHTTMGDHPQAMPVYDLDSVSLLQAMVRLESGTDMGADLKGNPNTLDGTPVFFKGCCVTPCTEEVGPQIIKLEKKVEAGAQFVQTQAVYEPAAFERFMKQAAHMDVPILVGIVMLKTAGMAKYMNRSVPGVHVPDWIIQKLSDAPKEDRRKVSTAICAQLIREMKPLCRGAHLMTLGWDHCVPDIIAQAEA